ncbi:LCP family protein [Streptomyces ziwulingensis]|uniref:LCP family protein n=1 Tax=Streptomyces ziwulingensis TaxID=1045501 RepID=A0ABP9CVM4_9ACTN
MTQSTVRAPRARGEGPGNGPGDGAGNGSGDGGDGGDGPRGNGRRGTRGHRVLRWSASTLAVLILGTSGAGYLYYEHLNGNLDRGRRDNGDTKPLRAEANAAGQTPLNILLIGSDSRDSDENVKLGGSRDTRGNPPLGDVQMLIHLAADRRSASVVSIPRDTRVDIPECTDPESGDTYPATNDIINTSLARGGAGCTLATWQNLTGVYIDHWMTIDFAGVVRMADAIGGVAVCVEQNVWDRPLPGVPGGSGLKLEAGTRKVRGEQALQWLRTRHAWGSDPLRARAQHMYLNSMLRTLKDQNVFTDPGRLMGLAEAATKSLTVSEEIGTVKDLYDLGGRLRTVPTDRVTMTTLPTVPDPQDANHLVAKDGEAERIWRMLRDDVPFDDTAEDRTDAKPEADAETDAETEGEDDAAAGGDAEPETGAGPADSAAADAEIGVLVRNGTRSATDAPVRGRAGTVARALVGRGFARAATDTSAAVAEERTVVSYPSAELAADARRVAKSLGIAPSSVERSTEVSGVTVVVGADWREGTTYPEQAAPEAGELPADTDAIKGSDTGQCMDVYAPYRW